MEFNFYQRPSPWQWRHYSSMFVWIIKPSCIRSCTRHTEENLKRELEAVRKDTLAFRQWVFVREKVVLMTFVSSHRESRWLKQQIQIMEIIWEYLFLFRENPNAETKLSGVENQEFLCFHKLLFPLSLLLFLLILLSYLSGAFWFSILRISFLVLFLLFQSSSFISSLIIVFLFHFFCALYVSEDWTWESTILPNLLLSV